MSLEKEENEQLKTVLQDKFQQEKVVDLLVRKRPHGWGRRSVAPYFKEVFGKEAKAVLDEMMESRQDQVYDYHHFQSKFGINANTLYLRVNQSIMYVVEMMDTPDRKYARFCQMFTVRRKRGVGVVLEFRPECRDGAVSDFKPKPVEAVEEQPKWMQRMHKFLEEGEVGETFLQEKLVLTREEIETLENALKVPGVLCNITSYSVKILKIAV